VSSWKSWISAIIVFSFVAQIGNIILKKTKFEEIFKTFTGVIFVILLITKIPHFNNLIDFDKLTIKYDKTAYNANTNYEIKKSFQNKLSEIIQNDLHNIFYVNILVDVKTDLEMLKIYLRGSVTNDMADKITAYVQNKYCTPHDEVIFINGNTN